MATTPTFRPADETMCDDDRQLSPEHVRRLIRNTLWGFNERCVQIGTAFSLLQSDGTARRTLWRASARWNLLGPFKLYIPDAIGAPTLANVGIPTVRLLINFRTVGTGKVGLWACNFGVGVESENEMEAVWNAGAAVSGPYAIVSSVTSGSEEVAIELPVHPGWNRFYIALKCEDDQDDTPQVIDPTYRSFASSAAINQVRHPTVLTDDFANLPNVYAPFQYIDVAESALAYLAGIFTRYTIPRIISVPVSGAPDDATGLCFEATLSEWENARDAGSFVVSRPNGPEVYGVIGDLVRCYIDGISVDGTSSYSLEDRQFGSAHRYFQLVSGAQTGLALREALALHESRLPQASPFQDVEYDLDVGDSITRGVPGLWRQAVLSSTYQTTSSQNVGVYDSATLLPEVLPGYKLEVEICFDFIVCDTAQQTSDQFQPLIEARAFLTDPSLAVTYGDPVIQRGVLVPAETRLSWQSLWSLTRGVSSGCTYGCEGMSTRTDIGYWTSVTCTVTPPSSFSTDDFRLAAVQIRSTDGSSPNDPPGRVITVGPIGVRFKQVPL